MPPDGFTRVTISDELAPKLAQLMSRHEYENYAEAIDYAVNATLAQEAGLSTRI